GIGRVFFGITGRCLAAPRHLGPTRQNHRGKHQCSKGQGPGNVVDHFGSGQCPPGESTAAREFLNPSASRLNTDNKQKCHARYHGDGPEPARCSRGWCVSFRCQRCSLDNPAKSSSPIKPPSWQPGGVANTAEPTGMAHRLGCSATAG